jgi:hypothetical protein
MTLQSIPNTAASACKSYSILALPSEVMSFFLFLWFLLVAALTTLLRLRCFLATAQRDTDKNLRLLEK